MKKLILLIALLVMPVMYVLPQLSYAQMALPIKATVAIVTLTSANTEYSWTVPNGTGSYTIKSRTAADFTILTTTGGDYITVPSGTAYCEQNISSSNNTLIFKSANAGQVIEIIYWKGK